MEYFANLRGDEFVNAFRELIKENEQWLQESGYASKIKRKHAMYNNLRNEIERAGNLSRISANIFRNTISHVAILVSQNKLDYEFAAANTDSDALNQTKLARTYIRNLAVNEGLDSVQAKCLKLALIADEAFLHAPYNKQAGIEKVRDPETGRVAAEGRQVFTSKSPFDIARDVTNPENKSWIAVRDLVPKVELIALYPDQREAIENAETRTVLKDFTEINNFVSKRGTEDKNAYVWHIYHERTSAVPNGLQAMVCGDAILGEIQDLQYDEIPVVRLAVEDVIGSVAGTSFTNDLVALQAALDKLLTIILSTQVNLGLVSVWSPYDIKMQDLATGFAVLRTPVQPQPINFANNAAGTVSAIQMFEQYISKLSGITDLLRGTNPQGVTAASALSLLLNQSIAFASEFSRNYAAFAASVANIAIKNIKFVPSEILIASVGKDKVLQDRVNKDSFSTIQKVHPMLGNPLQNTQHSRETRANDLLAKGMIKNPGQYAAILDGAPLSILTEDEVTEEQLIRAENEELRTGNVPPVLIDDTHPLHIQGHKALLNVLAIRRDPMFLAAVNEHIKMHEEAMAAIAASSAPPPPPGAPETDPNAQTPALPAPERDAGVALPNLPAGVPDDRNVLPTQEAG